MQATTLKELEWIHDCALLGVLYDTSSDAGQSIRLTMPIGISRFATGASSRTAVS